MQYIWLFKHKLSYVRDCIVSYLMAYLKLKRKTSPMPLKMLKSSVMMTQNIAIDQFKFVKRHIISLYTHKYNYITTLYLH